MAALPLERFLHWEQQQPDRVFLRQPINGVWKTLTWAEAGAQSRRLAAGLLEKGIQPGDHVALLSKNCAQWILTDLAIMMAGAVSIPLYPTLTAASINTILVHSDARAVIVGKLDNFKDQRSGIPDNVWQIGMETYDTATGTSWESIVENHAPLNNLHPWKQDEIFTIIYTSGTTGNAKGVMHKTSAFGIVLEKVTALLKIPAKPIMFSYLPLSHVAERMAVEMNVLYNGGTISFAESLDTFQANLESVQPDAFFAVPRIWAKFREGILKKLPQQKLNTLLKIPIVKQLVKKSIRKKLGLGNACIILSAAAPISVELLEWFDKLGIRILQVYGMSEDSVYGHFNTHDQNKFGSVGKPLEGLQVKFSDQGEILVKSPGNFVGYYKEEALSKESFDEEQYLRTGDKAEYDAEGFLFITGRVKDQFKTDKGKYVSPAPIELRLHSSKLIEQVCVVGMGIPQPIALLTLSEEGKKRTDEEVNAELTSLLNEVNPSLEHFERLEKMVILKNDWTVENGLMTPTLKVKRNELEKIYLPHYPEWYHRKGKVVRE